MRLHRFYIEDRIVDRSSITITDLEKINQIANVFRLVKEDKVILFDGLGVDFTCEILSIGKATIELKILEKNQSRFMPEDKVILFQALVKKDKFEWIVEKATELGVSFIVPIIAERSEKKDLNYERLNRIAIEASEQSGRGNIPTILPIVTLNEIFADNSLFFKNIISQEKPDQSFVFDPEGQWITCGRKVEMNAHKSIAIYIGTEGGWTWQERDQFHKNNLETFSLGKQILRSETAVIAALSVVLMK